MKAGLALARAVAQIREQQSIRKKPSIAETLDWARALLTLGKDSLDETTVNQTLNLLLKRKADQDVFTEQVGARRLVMASQDEKR